jgi:hypothetical protein
MIQTNGTLGYAFTFAYDIWNRRRDGVVVDIQTLANIGNTGAFSLGTYFIKTYQYKY